MTDVNQKIGHRNYKKIEIDNLSPEQKHAWETRYHSRGHILLGCVPQSWTADPDTGKWKISYFRVIFSEGFTFVEDDDHIYDVVEGIWSRDQISLRNKGKTTKDLLSCYHQFIADTLYPQRESFF